MNSEIRSIEIFSEQFGPVVGGTEFSDDNTDVVVEFEDGTRYVATFFSYENIENLRRKNASTGECLHGKYFWASDMILIDRIERESIINVIEELLKAGSFTTEFSQAV